jgi:glutaredoxin
MNATIYTLPNCPWCVKAKKLCDALEIRYTEEHGMHADWPTVPYILLDGEPIGGFTEFAQRCRKL